jgi:NOL1/NOP2/sun family putative RNA methylase
MVYQPKPEFIERINLLLNNKEDVEKFFEVAKTKPRKSIRVNTLKISPEELKSRLIAKGWEIKQIPNHPEIMQIISELQPGELGKTKEHILGYYYCQEITSMMPILALNPKPDEILLDLCASPGSKTTQAAALMQNKGTIIANDVSMSRVSILCTNLEKISVTNSIVTRHDGFALCNRLKKINFKFDKILVDAPCSGEGNIRLSPRTYLEWSEALLNRLSKVQKKLAESAFQLLKPNGIMVYSTCTHSPEENEFVIQHLIDTFQNQIQIQEINLPIKTRPGITQWKDKKLNKEINKAVRIYHHDNNMEGFFLCKIRKLSDNIK